MDITNAAIILVEMKRELAEHGKRENKEGADRVAAKIDGFGMAIMAALGREAYAEMMEIVATRMKRYA